MSRKGTKVFYIPGNHDEFARDFLDHSFGGIEVVEHAVHVTADGKKMSKRLNNYPDPMEVMEKYGSDSLRMYLASSPVMEAENLNFNEKEVAEFMRGMFRRKLKDFAEHQKDQEEDVLLFDRLKKEKYLNESDDEIQAKNQFRRMVVTKPLSKPHHKK
jgi:isoleucyl-tRNA synthetase